MQDNLYDPKKKDDTNPRQSIDEINLMLLSGSTHEKCNVDRSARPKRRHPAHGVHISPSKPTIVYVTICCQDRVPWLATEHHHTLLRNIWQDNSHWIVGRYVLMPDHLHLLASPQPDAVKFDSWARYIKSQFTKHNKVKEFVWQTDHWDTRIRSLSHFEEKTIYMVNNPVRAGLVTSPEEWPYQGVIYDLRWD